MRRVRGDAGAYAILYALLLVIVIGVAAIVIDLAAMRQDRRESRLASDAAVVYAARNLDPLTGGNPQQACFDAWSYVHTDLNATIPASTGCTNFPTSATPCPASFTTATAKSGDVKVTVTWPIFDTGPTAALLTNPDAAPAGTTTQRAIDPATDGANPCARLAVTVSQTRQALFATMFGLKSNSTTVTSVARATSTPGNGADIAALNVLNQTTCDAIVMSGQAFLQINSVGGRPGIISVESNGRQQSNVCPNSSPYVIDAAKNASGGYIHADGPGGVGQGTILAYALNTSPTGNPTQVYNPSLVPPGNTLLMPKPTTLSQRSGETPVTNYYSCKGTCTTVPQDYIGLLETTFKSSGTPAPYTYADAPYNALPFVTLPGGVVPPGGIGSFACTVGNGAKVYLPPANYFLNCPTLTVQGTLIIGGGTVVTAGNISVKGACFAMNVPTGTTTCPTVSSGNVNTASPKMGMLYQRTGSITTQGAYSIFLPRTFVYQGNGTMDIAANGNVVFWTNPRVTDVTCTSDTCTSQRFAKLALWNRTSSVSSGSGIGGQGSLTMRGILFMPRQKFTYTGQAAQSQTNAQFWADNIEVKGQGGITMAPDPTDSVATPLLSVVLIR
jgi:hypothetical protein